MANARESIHGQWSSRWMFILAATGSAVGLGNVWRFPYLVGENGGGAFVLVYLACVALVGIPLLMAEVMLGRRGRRSPINTMRALARDEGLSTNWAALGWLGVGAGFLILSFYSVVAGWSLAYVVMMINGTFNGTNAAATAAEFGGLVASPGRLLFWHTVFMVLTVSVVARGVSGGLERAVKYLMPALLILLLLMVGYAIGNGAFEEAMAYLFRPDFARLTPASLLEALGQAFFSLSLGMGAIMIYGSYLPANESIPQTSVIIALADTGVAVLSGLAIFPIVFAYGLAPESGPGLVFQTLTIPFGHMWGGQVFGTLFFLLLSVAGWTSAISLLEPASAWLVENLGTSRLRACILTGVAAWVMGVGSLLSFNLTADMTLFDKNFFELVEYLSANLMLPIGGMFIAIFAGWRLSRASAVDELGIGQGRAFAAWHMLVRYVAPVAVLLVLINILNPELLSGAE